MIVWVNGYHSNLDPLLSQNNYQLPVVQFVQSNYRVIANPRRHSYLSKLLVKTEAFRPILEHEDTYLLEKC